MSVTINEVKAKLEEAQIKTLPGVLPDSVRAGYKTEKFVDPDTHEKALVVVISLEENGEYIKIYSPHAMTAEGPHADELLKACMMIQWDTKLIQFEYDDNDGEIRPVIEWPIEDGSVTSLQLRRAVSGMANLVDQFYPVLEEALTEGKIDMSKGPFKA